MNVRTKGFRSALLRCFVASLRRNKVDRGKARGDRSLDTVVCAVKWAYNPNYSPNLDASPNH